MSICFWTVFPATWVSASKEAIVVSQLNKPVSEVNASLLRQAAAAGTAGNDVNDVTG